MLSLGSIDFMELEIMAFVVSVPISIPFPVPIPMPRFTNGRLNVVDFLYLSCCCWHESQTFSEKKPSMSPQSHIVCCVLASSKNREISVLLEAYFFCLFKKCCGFSKFLCKKNYLGLTKHHVHACCLMALSELKYSFF